MNKIWIPLSAKQTIALAEASRYIWMMDQILHPAQHEQHNNSSIRSIMIHHCVFLLEKYFEES